VNIKYKVVYKLIKDNNVVAYKIFTGVFIFFVSAEVLHKGMEQGLIEICDLRNIEEYSWWSMECNRGKVTNYRIQYAIEHSTLDYLRSSLEILNNMPKVIKFDYLFMDTVLFTIAININNDRIIDYHEIVDSKGCYWSFKNSKTSLDVLDFLCDHLDRSYMNSRNLVDKIKEVKGRETPIGPYVNKLWIRFEEDKNLKFKDVAYKGEI
jgi:hypothetical protein